MPIDKELTQFKAFLDLVRVDPQVLHSPQWAFLKEFIESFGGVIPESPKEPSKSKEKNEPEKVAEPVTEEDSNTEESEVELDETGIIENPDVLEDDEEFKIQVDLEISEEDVDKANEKKIEAIGLYGEGNYEKASAIFTEAIKFNPGMSLLYVKRGQCYLQLNKPNACIRDCTRALAVNPDNAAAYKFRGRAHRLLGHWLNAVKDLRNACRIDFDEQTDEWLKEVTPNARKIEEHQRKYERKRAERDIKEKQKRLNKAREEHAKASGKRKPDFGSDFGMDGGAGDFQNLYDDPELLKAFKDPEVCAAFTDLMKNPANMKKYMNDPKIMKLITQVTSKLGAEKLFSSFPGFGGGSNAPSPSSPPPPPPPPPSSSGLNGNDDIGLD